MLRVPLSANASNIFCLGGVFAGLIMIYEAPNSSLTKPARVTRASLAV